MVSTTTKYPYVYVIVNSPLFKDADPYVIRLAAVFRLAIALIDSPLTAIHFWFRYDVVCNQNVWTWRTYGKIYSVFLMLTLCEAVKMLTGGFDDRNPHSSDAVNDGIAATARYIYFSMQTGSFIVGIVLSQTQPLVEYSLICYFGWKIYKNVKATAARSINTTLAAQRTLVKIMALQAIYPLILHFIPVVFIQCCVIIHIHFGSASTYVLGAPMHLTPILNAVSILTLMPSYRRGIRDKKTSITVAEYSNNWTTKI
uniref:G protein-coupled receptor n=1 Tax=Bursaphelenchus xylophilus TaxID=6326 RepID=A0A1I7SEP9_BURXY